MKIAKCQCGWIGEPEYVKTVKIKGKNISICPLCNSDTISVVEGDEIDKILMILVDMQQELESEDGHDINEVDFLDMIAKVIPLVKALKQPTPKSSFPAPSANTGLSKFDVRFSIDPLKLHAVKIKFDTGVTGCFSPYQFLEAGPIRIKDPKLRDIAQRKPGWE